MQLGCFTNLIGEGVGGMSDENESLIGNACPTRDLVSLKNINILQCNILPVKGLQGFEQRMKKYWTMHVHKAHS